MTLNVPEYIYTAEVTVWNGSSEETHYFTDAIQYITASTDTPASTVFLPRLVQPVLVQRDAFDTRKTMGRSRIGYGQCVLNNPDGALDTLLTYGVDGRALVVRRGVAGAAYPAGFTTVFSGTMQQLDADASTITLTVRDQQAMLAVPFQPTKYAGSNSLPNGLEGVAGDLQGKPKPVCYGVAFNVPLPCVNTSKLIYQGNDGALASVDAVYDRGIALTYGGAYSTLADLQDDALEPNPGEYKVYLAGGYIRLGSTPAGDVTADLTQGANAAARTAGQIFSLVLQRAGLTSGDWNATDITALDTANSAVLGFWTMDETTCDSVADQVAASVGAAWFPDVTGVFRIKQLTAPSGTPDLTLTQDDCLLSPALQQVRSNDTALGLPCYQSIVQYARNYTVQNTDFVEPSLTCRARVTATTATTLTVRVAVADPFPQGANSATITYQDHGSGGVTPSSPQSVTPAATLTEASGTYVDFTITLAAFGAGPGRVTFTVNATDRQPASDATDVPEQGAAKAITFATSAPSSPATNDLWIDTSASPNVWNRWSGSAWVSATPTTADQIAETGALKWASEHGADVTSGKSLTVLINRTADNITYTGGGTPTVDSLKPAESGAEQTTGKSVDILVDGSTYARTKASELSSGQVQQTVDTVEATTLTTNKSRREAIMWATVI